MNSITSARFRAVDVAYHRVGHTTTRHRSGGNITVPRFRKVDPSVLEQEKKRPAGRQPSPEQLELIKQDQDDHR